MKKFNHGLKLFSINIEHAQEAKTLLEQGVFQYLELYAIPGSFSQTIHVWEDLLPHPCIIHAPHFAQGVNLSNPHLRKENKRLLADSILFADKLSAPYIIVHGGFNGNIKEMIYQISTTNDPRFILENTPKQGINNHIASAWSPTHMVEAIQSTCFGGIVLDIGHALCAANSEQIPWETYLLEFIALNPKLFHLSDGFTASTVDTHKRFGEGDFDISRILSLLPTNSEITLETPKNFTFGLKEAKEDSNKIRTL